MNENQNSGPRSGLPGEPTWEELAEAGEGWDEFDRLCETIGHERAESIYAAAAADKDQNEKP